MIFASFLLIGYLAGGLWGVGLVLAVGIPLMIWVDLA